MGTPQKNIGQLLESPYAKHLQQYPSQSEEYVPNEFGGKMRSPSSTPSKQQYQGNNYQPHSSNRRRGNNRYFNTNSVGNSGGGERGYRNNYQNNYQNNYNQQQANRHSNSGNRQQPYHGQRFNKPEGNSRNDYYHPSMLWDPWKDLLERHNAINNSQINVPETTTTTEEQESSQRDESSTQDEAITTAIPTTTTKETSPSISP